MNRMIELFQLVPVAFWTMLVLLLHGSMTIVIVIRVVMSNRSVGAALAWIAVVFLFPILGPTFYLLIGELRLGARRVELLKRLLDPVDRRYRHLDRLGSQVDWSAIGDEGELLSRAGHRMLRVPTLPGNKLELISHWEEVFERLIADIDSAEVNCDLEFYIWHAAGKSEDVALALERAAGRGVACRILVDALGSKAFLYGATAKRLRAAGVNIQAALPGGLWRLLFVRFDLRLHRKIILIDDQIAWTGSLNMVDPRYFKQSAG